MKLEFRGWSRRVIKAHVHDVTPVKLENRYNHVSPESSIWRTSDTAMGRVTSLGLSGDFLVSVKVTESDMAEWIDQLIKEDRDRAVSLLVTKLASATAAWSPKMTVAERIAAAKKK